MSLSASASKQAPRFEPLAVAAIDYLDLDSATLEIIQQCTYEVNCLKKPTNTDALKIGEILVTVRQRLKYGQFTKWLDTEFGWSCKKAYRSINVYNCFSCVNLTQLSIPLAALYNLAKPAETVAARQEALQPAVCPQCSGKGFLAYV